MAGLVTKPTTRSVDEFIHNIDSPSKRKDSKELIELITKLTGYEPVVWGNNKVPDFLIGFGKYTYQRKASKEDFEWFHIGFAPRKSKLTIYLTYDLSKQSALLSQLGKCKWGKGCLYLKKLSDIDINVLQKLILLTKDNAA